MFRFFIKKHLNTALTLAFKHYLSDILSILYSKKAMPILSLKSVFYTHYHYGNNHYYQAEYNNDNKIFG